MTTARARWREARNAEIARLAQLGVPSAKIARIMRVSIGVVHRVRAEAEIPTNRRPPLTQEQRERAHQLLLDGTSRREAAKSVGASEGQLQRAFPDLKWDEEQNRLAQNELRQYRFVPRTASGRMS